MLDLLLYSSIRDYIYARITFFTEQVLSNNLTLALTIVLGLLTLWVMIQGYLIATGRSQEGLKGFVYNLGKSYFIVAIALGVAAGGNFGVRTLTDTLSDGISQIMTGDSDVGSKCLTQQTTSIVGCKIDQNLIATQSMLSLLDGIDTNDDNYLEGKITQARWFAGVGTAGPAIVAGGMLIIFRIAMALFIGFAPIFILCLLFKKTAPLFQKWLYYGLATIFSGVMLGVMADISMDLVTNLGVTDAISSFTGVILTGQSATGIMQTVTQQLGLGLLLSTLLITVPPMAGLFFNGVMGSYSGWNTMSGWNGGTQQSAPPGISGGTANQTEDKIHHQYKQMGQAHGNDNFNVNAVRQSQLTTGGYSNSVQPESIKQHSQLGNAAPSTVNTAAQVAQQNIGSDKSKMQKGEES